MKIQSTWLRGMAIENLIYTVNEWTHLFTNCRITTLGRATEILKTAPDRGGFGAFDDMANRK